MGDFDGFGNYKNYALIYVSSVWYIHLLSLKEIIFDELEEVSDDFDLHLPRFGTLLKLAMRSKFL